MDGCDVKHLIITGVKFTGRPLGSGAYGKVFAVEYNGDTCAAKEIHSILLEKTSQDEQRLVKQRFLKECLLHSKLHHPNIVKMLGVYYRNDQAVLPILVMELVKYKLTQLLDYHNIPMYVKLSIIQDVSKAIGHLHTLNPPIMHCDLSSNSILLTTSLVAKVCDFGVSKPVLPLASKMTVAPGTTHFMPPEALMEDPHYGLPLDVFSFGCVVCHVITQQWPQPSDKQHYDYNVGRTVTLSEIQRRRQHIDQISEGLLRQLVRSCLDEDPKIRPPISQVNKRITSIITG